jgi:hypothetical protein
MIIGELISGDNTWKFILPPSSLLAGRVISFIGTGSPIKKISLQWNSVDEIIGVPVWLSGVRI